MKRSVQVIEVKGGYISPRDPDAIAKDLVALFTAIYGRDEAVQIIADIGAAALPYDEGDFNFERCE